MLTAGASAGKGFLLTTVYCLLIHQYACAQGLGDFEGGEEA